MVNQQRPRPTTGHSSLRLGWPLLGVMLITATLSGCLTTRSSRNGYLLTAQTIRGNRIIDSDQLESLIPQKPNNRVLGLPISPRLWFYEQGLRHYNRDAAAQALQAKTNEFDQQSQQLADQPAQLRKLNRRYGRQLKRLRQKAEEGNWLMRNLGEPPSYFSERDAQTNTTKMQKYLFDKGFFNAETGYRLDTLRGRQIRVRYRVTEHAGYYLRSVAYTIDDPRVDSLVRRSLPQGLLRVDDRFDLDNVANEKIRIESLLRDEGYYAFSRQYVRFGDVDTVRRATDSGSLTDSLHRPVDIGLRVLNPPGQPSHPLYQIGAVDVRISPDETQPAALATRPDTVSRNGITYFLGGRNLSTRLLDSKIQLRPGQLYSQTRYRDTQRQLFLLNQFKFVNLNFTDTTNRQLRTLITATPLDKYEATAEGGLTVLYQAQGYPGGFGSLIFRARNLFGGLETFELSGRFGIEAQTGFLTNINSSRETSVYNSQELGISSSLTFPQILFPGPIRRLFIPYNPRTQISLSYNNTYRPDFRRSLLRGTMAYNWQTSPTKQFSFLIADINLINANFDTRFGPLFQRQLDSLARLGSTIKLSFRRSLSSSISFAYTYNTNLPNQPGSSGRRSTNFLRTVIESGGTTLNFLPNRLIDTTTRSLQFYKFVRFNVDYRHYIPLRPRTTLAFRVNTGLAYGYGPDGGPVPYEKLFFAGGSNSVRAWLPRRLGPGAAQPDLGDNGQYRYLFEQPGDLLLEGSAELRGRLFHLGADINGALFIDAGNVWTLSKNAPRPGAAFALDTFVPQIAVGTGVGLRFDFSFFVIRFDGGIKVWDPARQYFRTAEGTIEDQRFLLPQFSLRRLTSGPNPLIINFGIGYPF